MHSFTHPPSPGRGNPLSGAVFMIIESKTVIDKSKKIEVLQVGCASLALESDFKIYLLSNFLMPSHIYMYDFIK